MFEFPTPTKLTLKKASPRKEHHGDQLVQAIDLDVEWQTANSSLSMLHGSLLTALYCRNANTEAQAEVPGVPSIHPNLRFAALEGPLKWDLELIGRNFRVHRPLGGRSDLVLPLCKVKKFRVSALEGGSVTIGFQVQCDTDVTATLVGKLCSLEGEPISATLLPSDEADPGDSDDDPVDDEDSEGGAVDFAENPALKPGKDATELFMETQP